MRLFTTGKKFNTLRGKEAGVSLIETLIALALLGIIAATFLSGLTTAAKATFIADERATAESLARSQMEYVKSLDYQYAASEYPVDPELTIPEGWVVPPPVVEPLHDTDDGIQKITVTVKRNDKPVLTVENYKVDR